MTYYPTIASFYKAGTLNWVEQLSIKSFMDKGHKFVLYTQGEVSGVPEGAEVRSADEILFAEGTKAFQNARGEELDPEIIPLHFFRWWLQKKTDYLYVNLDKICLRPINSWSREQIEKEGLHFFPDVMRYPKDSAVIDKALNFLEPYPIPPWYWDEDKQALQKKKLAGNPVHISTMEWAKKGHALLGWARSSTESIHPKQNKLNKHGGPRIKRMIFQPKAQFEIFDSLGNDLEPVQLLELIWEQVKIWKPQYINQPPPDSWIAMRAKALGVDIAANPVIEETKPAAPKRAVEVKEPYYPTVAGFWIGPYLSWIDQMGIKSFIDKGHKFILYTQGEVLNVPEGVEVRPASEIWFDKAIGGYKGYKLFIFHPAPLLSDFFRWHLQKKTDYLYVDLDKICLRPMNSWSREEIAKEGLSFLSQVMRFPKDSPMVDEALKFLKPYPIPPWFSAEERKELWWKKLTGRAVHINTMKWATAGDQIKFWAMRKHRGFHPTENKINVYNENNTVIKMVFQPKQKFEIFDSVDMPNLAHVLGVQWTNVYDWKPELLDAPPPDSWIVARAKALDIDIAAAPVIETREKNRAYIADMMNDKSYLS